MNILLIGEMAVWGTSRFYKKAFEQEGHNVSVIDPSEFWSPKLWDRILNRALTILIKIKKEWGTRIYTGSRRFNDAILKKAKGYNPDLVFCDSQMMIKETTISALQNSGAKVFSLYSDDILNPRSVTRIFYRSLPLFDCHFTTKSYQFNDFKKLGAKKVVFIPFAVDIEAFYPESISQDTRKKLGSDLIFVGNYYEKERAEFLEKLCRKGYALKVYGNGWDKCQICECLKRNKCLASKYLEGNDYRQALNASKIALAFLSKMNRDLHTRRTFEIPASGTFMLHERTKEAKSFFGEGKEAEFFGSFEELSEKIEYYLSHEKEREKIAKAGYERASSYEYSYKARVKTILKVFRELD